MFEDLFNSKAFYRIYKSSVNNIFQKYLKVNTEKVICTAQIFKRVLRERYPHKEKSLDVYSERDVFSGINWCDEHWILFYVLFRRERTDEVIFNRYISILKMHLFVCYKLIHFTNFFSIRLFYWTTKKETSTSWK